MIRTKLYKIHAAASVLSILGSVILLGACNSLAAKLNDQTTTISPANLHHASAATESHGSIRASERLMKELKEIRKSDNYKSGLFSIELVNDNLYEWRVNLSFPDPSSVLHKELKALKSKGKGEHVVLKMTFNANYPAEPPFVRIAYPALKGDTIHPGGIICSQILSKQFWKSNWSMESFLLALAGQLVEYKVGVNEHSDVILPTYTDENAKKSFADTILLHEKHGRW